MVDLHKAMLGSALLLITQIICGGLSAQDLARPDRPTENGCAPIKPGPDPDKFFQEWIEKYGGQEFRNPPAVGPTSPGRRYTLEVRYGDNVLVGCAVHLRSYNGMLLGPTIRAKPGDTLHLTLINHLPNHEDPHPQNPPPSGHDQHFSFNITNLHTHGLHTAPQGSEEAEGDNVLLEIPPGKTQKYEIHIPENHPSGTFWYHAHVHGATAIQVASGMAGALVIDGGHHDDGGLDGVPQIARAREQIFVLQQFNYGLDGQIENFTQPGDRNWLSRGVMVNGQLVPTIRMRPGEIQRWRFIHAGVEDNIHLSLDEHELYEIADDGIALGRWVKWPATELIDGARNPIVGPGYRLAGCGNMPFQGAAQRISTKRKARGLPRSQAS